MKKMFQLSRWFLGICMGVWLGVWLEADLDPVHCPKEGKLCSDTRCRKYPGNPFIEECTYLKCKHGHKWISDVPSHYSCCESVETGDPRIPDACCNIPYYEIQCKTGDGQACTKEILPQDCDGYFSPGICPPLPPPGEELSRKCIGVRRP